MARHRWQTALSFLAIAFGVAIVVAVDLANQSARRAFAISLDSVTGAISHQIVSNSQAIDEQLFVALRTELGIAPSAPKLQASIKIRGETFTLLGVDPVSETAFQQRRFQLDSTGLTRLLNTTNGVLLPQQTLQRLGLQAGDSLTAGFRDRQLQLTIAAAIAGGNEPLADSLIITDIAIAQHVLGRPGELDYIDLQLNDAQAQKVSHWLPPQYRLVDAQGRNLGLLAISRAFHTNLTAMSLLALLVGALLIYNTMTFAALQRQNMIGTYRALGVTRRELLTLVLGESLILALLASLAGLALGYLLSQQLVQLVTRTINDLYFSLRVSQFTLAPSSLVKGLLLGVASSLLAALQPALRASRTAPITLQRRSATEGQWRRRYTRLAGLGLLATAAGYGISLWPGQSLPVGFICLGAVALGFCLMVPLALLLFCRALTRLLKTVSGGNISIAARLAIRGIPAGISRTGVAVAALSVAIATVVGVSIMIGSFRYSVMQWLDQSLIGDIYITQPGASRATHQPGIPAQFIAELQQLTGIAHITEVTSFRAETPYGRIRTVSLKPPPGMPGNSPLLIQQTADTARPFASGDGVLISEPLAYHQQLRPGDKLTLYGENGPQRFAIIGVFRDYSSSRGLISLPPGIKDSHWPNIAVNSLSITAKANVDQGALLARIRHLLRAYPGHLQLSHNRDIRRTTLNIFDQTFAITQVLRLLVLIVAFTGLLSALLALQLEQARQYAALRATGMGAPQLSRLLLLQSTLLGVFAALAALPLGYVLADRLIQVINRRSFGWSMEAIFPWEVLPQSLLLAVAAALLASVYPWLKMRRQHIASHLREE